MPFTINPPRYEVLVAVDAPDVAWFQRTVIVEAPTRVIAAMRAEADVRREHELDAHLTKITSTVLGMVDN